MPFRRLSLAVSPLLRCLEWLFSELAPGVDLFLGLLGIAWLALMVRKPAVFDAGNLAGMQWLPDRAWMGFLAIIVALHLFGLVRPSAVRLRVPGILLSSWYWMLVSISLTRISLAPGTFTYALIGAAALGSAIYVSGRPASSA